MMWNITRIYHYIYVYMDTYALDTYALLYVYSTANKIFAFLASNGWAGLSAERPLPARAGHLWYCHLLSRWRHL